ncbi:MAG: flagellar hook-basal body complex protein [Sulfuricurvum sp.]|uniref:flagellar hook protein FlgE n=1 Tax=Sulfuricurvum sp. TaxID=2025608 RepID=UPI0026173467|nr:flagellar hook-basal body complex protein [Sulfuricurvum sp.]MDD2367887.1 flagellar hook-basal body complex protein [Sulfuricurvum sp.]MDD2950016.1 flagellar hook-basal body complex protein [Sulfuricurvum sp.]MDD5119469.1 flagellar hook-basal body complex protein [Sulfuricurvum sp.]
MTQGYYAAISGMQTNQYGMDVISDNLTNVSTTGYKSSSTEFADLFSNVVSSANTPTYNDIGYGVKLQATSFNLTQGSMMSSDRFNDLALEGNGWFGVTSKNQTMFTRDGSFSFDTYQKTSGDVNSSTNRLVTADGQFVTGTMLSNFTYNPTFDYGDQSTTGATGAFVLNTPTMSAPFSAVGSQGTIEFPTRLAYPVQPTTKATFVGNLGITDATRAISAQVISGNNDTNQLKLTFTKSAVQPATGTAWDVVATVTSTDGNTVYDTQNGQAIFSASGSLDSFNIASMNNDGTPVAIDLGTGFSGVIAVDGVGISGSSTSDGVSAGSLTKYGINADGIIVADFSNGRQSAIGRIAVYHFQNDQGLNREGGTYYTESSDSGKPLFWYDANGNAITGATVRSNSLESSNSDMSVGLTDMIVSQRAYQANSKIVTTVDEMIQKALQMHR